MHQAVKLLLTRQETRKEQAFNRAYRSKLAHREVDESLALEEEECEKRLERARSFEFKAAHFRSLVSSALQGWAKDKAANTPNDTPREEQKAHESPPRRTGHAVPTISFHEAPTFDPESGAPSARQEENDPPRSQSKRRVMPTWEDKKRVSLAQKKMKDPQWM